MQIYWGIFAIQLYWNHTSAWVISSKFAAFLQTTFFEEHLWRTASGDLHYNKKHRVSCFLSHSTIIIHQFPSYTRILSLIPLFLMLTLIPRILCIPTLISMILTLIPNHSHHDSPHSHPWFLHSHPDSHHSELDSPHSQLDFPHSHPDSPLPSFPSFRSLIPHFGLHW